MHLDPAELIKRFKPQSALALTLGQEQLTASLVRLEPQTGRVAPPIPAVSLKLGADAIIKNPTAAGAELAAALNAIGIRERRFVICIPPEWALTASADLPEVSPEDLRDYFEIRAEREFSSAASDLRLSTSIYNLPDGKKRATLAAVPFKNLEAIEAMMKAAGAQALSISLGLDGCLAESRLHFIPEEAKTALVVSTGGGIAALRILGIPAAETITFIREVRITLGRLPEAVRQQLKLAQFHGQQAKELRDAIGDELQKMGIACKESPSSPPAIQAAGLFLQNEPVAFEFVVTEPNPWITTIQRFNTKRGRQMALGTIAIILLPLLIWLGRVHRENSLQAEWEGMRNSVANLEALQQKTRQFRPWFESTPQNLQILQTLITAFPEKGEVWTKSIQIKGGAEGARGTKVICSGFARNQASLLGLMDRLLKTPGVTALSQRTLGNNPVQFTATYLWKPQNDQ